MVDLRSAAVPPLSDEDWVRGDPSDPLVIVYADFTCHECAVAHARLRASARPIRWAFRHFALHSRHPRSVALACAAEAAGRQGRFWEMHDALFEDQGHADDPHLWDRAAALGLDLDRFEAHRRDPRTAERVRRDVHGGLRAGVSATPTLFIAGRPHSGAPSAALIDALTTGCTPAAGPTSGPGRPLS